MENEIKVKFIISEDIDIQRLSEGAENNIIINPVFTIRSKFIPTSLSFGLTVLAGGIDFSESHMFEITIKNDKNGEIIYSTGINYIPANPSSIIDNFTFNINLKNISFENEGTYTTQLTLDDIPYTDSFEVKKDAK